MVKTVVFGAIGLYLLRDLFTVGKQVVTDYVKDNIDWSWKNVKTSLKNSTITITFDLSVLNKNSYGIELYGIDNAFIYYANKEVGKIRLPVGSFYEFETGKEVIIPFTIERSIFDIGLTIAEFATNGKFIGELKVKGTARTSSGDWDLEQTIDVTNA